MIDNMSKLVKSLRIDNLINGSFKPSSSERRQPIYDPGAGEEIGFVPFSTKEEVKDAIGAAEAAYDKWSKIPVPDRIQYLFRLKNEMESHKDQLARSITLNHGKTISEAEGELERAIQNVESAISVAYTLYKGEYMPTVASGIDEMSERVPLGVFASINPFNFPIMVPFWFIPYALVLGNTIVVKPSEITPLGMFMVGEIFQKVFPPGVVNIVNGAKEVVDELLSNPSIKGITFVGSTNVAKYIYKTASENGKKVSASGGAKNFAVVMPDAKLEQTVANLIPSFFGNAGQRCLANANLVAVGGVYDELKRKFIEASKRLVVGYGFDRGTDIGPLVTESAKNRVQGYIEKGIEEGAKLVLDGRNVRVPDYPKGFYLGPTIFDEVSPDMVIAKEEIFGPVANIMRVESIEEAIELINRSRYGNAASIFTTSGAVARKFASEVIAGNIGVNVAVAQPMAFFPFGGMKESFFGVLHPQIETVNFYTDRKIVIQRWF